MSEGQSDGFLRLISDKKLGEVLGVQIVAPNATDMINEASAYIQLESTVYDIAQTVHTHPTVSEIFMEAGVEAVVKRFINNGSSVHRFNLPDSGIMEILMFLPSRYGNLRRFMLYGAGQQPNGVSDY